MRSSLLLMAAVLAAGCATGRTAPARVVLVLPPQPTRLALVEGVVEQLEGSRGIQVVHPRALQPLMRQADSADPRLARVDPLLVQARSDLLALRHAEAEQGLSRALSLLEGSFTRHYAPGRLAEVQVLLGVVALRRGVPGEARRRFAEARALAPGLAMDARFSPQERQEFERAGQEPATPLPLDGPALRRLVSLESAGRRTPGRAAAVIVLDAPPVAGLAMLQGALYLDERAAFVGAAARCVRPDKAPAVSSGARRLGRELADLLRAHLGRSPAAAPPRTAASWVGRWGPLRGIRELVEISVSLPSSGGK